jgi:hypothetical protein
MNAGDFVWVKTDYKGQALRVLCKLISGTVSGRWEVEVWGTLTVLYVDPEDMFPVETYRDACWLFRCRCYT